ncbi:MAG: alginate export family protein [Sulfurovum sp.]|nr:alginate export family protein [Sulfurovum sp.]MCB4751635.1 alginate export family protein [Sulfurovum sp.]
MKKILLLLVAMLVALIAGGDIDPVITVIHEGAVKEPANNLVVHKKMVKRSTGNPVSHERMVKRSTDNPMSHERMVKRSTDNPMSHERMVPVISQKTIKKVTENGDVMFVLTTKGEIRPRYESVDVPNNGKEKAGASTNRLQLGVQIDLPQIKGLSTYFEGTNVSGLGNYWDLSTSTRDEMQFYQVVADPAQTRITQAYIDYAFGKTLIRAGRQGVNIDNQRFVGTVNWRQMPQTYDAVAVIDNSIKNLNLLAAYVGKVNTIFDKESVKPVKSGFSTASVILHAAYRLTPTLTLTAYDYLIKDITDTYGIAVTGNINEGPIKLNYRLEYAHQTNPTLTTPDKITTDVINTNYHNIQANLNINHGFLIGVQHEVLEEDKEGMSAPFKTPLATLHAHNGWADIFLATPDDGLVDMNGMIGYKSNEFGLAKVIYHTFSSNMAGENYGTEIDMIYKNKIPVIKGLSGMVKASLFTKNDEFFDPKITKTTKIWAMLDYKFDTK